MNSSSARAVLRSRQCRRRPILGSRSRYALSDVGGSNGGQAGRRSDSSLLFRIRTRNFMQHGANLSFLSTFPTEAEYLYPPMTFASRRGRRTRRPSMGSSSRSSMWSRIFRVDVCAVCVVLCGVCVRRGCGVE